jgi:hypothetical protein
MTIIIVYFGCVTVYYDDNFILAAFYSSKLRWVLAWVPVCCGLSYGC